MRRKRGDGSAGTMRQVVQIQRPTVSVDGLGDYTETHATVLSVPAMVEATSGIESQVGSQVAADVSHKIVTRWISEVAAVAPEWRVLMSRHDSPETFRVFDIVFVNNVGEANRFLELSAVERL